MNDNELSVPNLDRLRPIDAAKFVICSADDYAWSRAMVEEHQLGARTQVLFSPAFGQITSSASAPREMQFALRLEF